MVRTDILERKEDILQWISEHQSKSFICKQLKCNIDTLNNWLVKMDITYKGNQSGAGIRTSTSYKTAKEYLASANTISSHKLRLKLLRDKEKDHKCEICKLTTWRNKPIPLELHHKDGNHNNNKMNNLQLLCPNCHSQMPNNSGKGKRKKGM